MLHYFPYFSSTFTDVFYQNAKLASPVHSLLFTLSTFSQPRHLAKKGFSVLESHLLYKYPQIRPKTYVWVWPQKHPARTYHSL